MRIPLPADLRPLAENLGRRASEDGAGARRRGMGAARADEQDLLALYDAALPEVYGYLLRRCGGRVLAEDLTAEVFLAAVDAAHRGAGAPLGVAWLIGTARHKLVDHWRRQSREDRHLWAVDVAPDVGDPWDERLDALRAREVLAGLGPHHRSALVLRHVDDLPVPEVAALLGRSVHATETLLVRARVAFRRAYVATGEMDP